MEVAPVIKLSIYLIGSVLARLNTKDQNSINDEKSQRAQIKEVLCIS